jgi:hypothetical protein
VSRIGAKVKHDSGLVVLLINFQIFEKRIARITLGSSG